MKKFLLITLLALVGMWCSASSGPIINDSGEKNHSSPKLNPNEQPIFNDKEYEVKNCDDEKKRRDDLEQYFNDTYGSNFPVRGQPNTRKKKGYTREKKGFLSDLIQGANKDSADENIHDENIHNVFQFLSCFQRLEQENHEETSAKLNNVENVVKPPSTIYGKIKNSIVNTVDNSIKMIPTLFVAAIVYFGWEAFNAYVLKK